MSRRRRALVTAGLALLAGAWLAVWVIPLPARLATTGSPVVLWGDGTVAHTSLAPDDRWRVPVALDRVDPAYVRTLVTLEDSRFWWHPGVDPLAVLRAAAANVSQGRIVSGASTLTMQLVRVLEPRPRTLVSKLVEAVRAVQLEVRLSKEEILEAYLTFTPYGRNVEGIEAASLAMFGHSADALAPPEIATLLAIPQAPAARTPRPENEARLKAARDDIARRMLEAGALRQAAGERRVPDAEVLATLVASPVPDRLRVLPREAPHVAAWLAAQQPGVLRQPTTLNRSAQRVAERTLARHAEALTPLGIHAGAVVVVDPGTGRVQALVGGPDFWQDLPGAQIPAFAVPRSPGSALKPFIYAMALQEGLALPEQLVKDLPVAYGTWSPRNFDGEHAGLVRLEDALSRSLNLPFVGLLRELGVDRFLGLLRVAGVRSLRDEPGWYGLSVAAGGVELTPLELAGLYTVLARGGTHVPVAVVPRPESEALQVLEPGSVWLTRRALRLRDRPDMPSRRGLAGVPAGVAWKTGTSFGHRDAWAVGWTDRHLVLVWLGNLDQRPSVHLVGAEVAGPILFDVIEGLQGGRGERAAPQPPPPDLTPVRVCALSGHLPGAACPHTTTALAMERSVPTTPCPYHVAVDVDLATGLAVGPGCRQGPSEARTFVVWPAVVRRWLADGLRDVPEAPSPAPGCAGPGEAPVVVRPSPGQVTVLAPGVPAHRQHVPLEADGASPAGRLTWFVDGALVGSALADERLWWPPVEGVHEVVVVDEAGRAGRSRFEVRSWSGTR